jgi:hypothetical protein
MTNTIGIIGSNQSVLSGAGAIVTGSSSPASDNPTTKPLIPTSSAGISPRIVVDPLAGVITEFLNSNGQIQSQIPSSAVVAYLRVGLAADGQAKADPFAKHHATDGSSQVA